MPEISVIVPVYNVEKYISDCIDSILAQTFENFELMLIDDGSTDNSGIICDEYAKKDARVKVKHQVNQGQAAARNYGIKLAEGKWVHFVDGDDVIHPQMLEILYSMLKKCNVRISMCGAVENEDVPIDFYKVPTSEFKCYKVNEAYLSEIFSGIPYRYWVVIGKLIDIEIVRKIPFTVGKIYEDNAVVCQWLYEAQRVANTYSELYFYRINFSGTTKSRFSSKKIDFLWALEEQLSFYDRISYSEMLNEIWKYYLANATYIYKKLLEELGDKDAAKLIRTKIKKSYWRYKKKVKFDKEKYIYTIGVFHPYIIKIYWYYVIIRSKIYKYMHKSNLKQ